MMHLPLLDRIPVPRLRRRPRLVWTETHERPQVVAHRGSSVAAAEHTLTAYRSALEEGAEALECDVRLTADGHLVCVHDRRVDRTSNGRGIVSALELNDLEAFDWASWKHPWRELDDEADEAPETVLTLERLLDVVADWGRPIELAIETKHPTRYAGLVERTLIETLDRYGLARPRRGSPSRVRVMSFSWMSLRRCLELAPGLEMVYLMDRVPHRYRDGSLPLGSRVAGPSIDIVRAHPRYVAKAHGCGNQVHVWTVNDPADIALCADLGVDAIITDTPALAMAQLTTPKPATSPTG